MAVSKKYIIGIDIGGSKMIAALVKGGKVYNKIKKPTPKNRKKFFIELQMMVEQLIKKSGGQENIIGIGCGIIGVLDAKTGTILMADNLRILNGFNIKKWLSKKFGLEVRIDNDSRSFTRGEYLFGSGRGFKNIVGMTLGTGIGGGLVIDGKIFHGSFNSAGEIGHMIYSETEFEDLINVKSFKEDGFKSLLEIYQMAQSGNKKAKNIFKNLGNYLGIGFANIINILDPEAIIIGGGISGAAKFFLPYARQTMKKFVISPKSRKNVKIIIGNLGENAGAVGAAALFYEQ